MMFRIQLLVCTVFLLVTGAALAGQPDPILGKAGNHVIKRSDVNRMLAYYPQETQRRLQENPAEVEILVKRMLEVKIISEMARKEQFDRKPNIKKQLAYVMDDFLSKEYLEKVIMPDATVSEADLKEFYTQNKNDLAVPEQVRARHILFKVDPASSEAEKSEVKGRAEAVLKRAKAGEDFEKLAEAYSDDQSSRAKGGDLGYFAPGRMLPEFEGVAFYTDPGEISDIVETKYGYHIIKVEDHVEARQRSFEEMKDYIRERLQKQVVMFKIQKYIQEAVENAGIRIYSDQIVDK